jgi:hypothetical protein
MKRSSVLASIAAVIALACASIGVGCVGEMAPSGDPATDSPHARAAQHIYYATPEIAAHITPDGVRYRAASAPAPSAEQLPYVMGEAGLVPATSEDIESAGASGDEHPESSSSSSSGNSGTGAPHCSLCEYDVWCGPICCPGQPHCKLYEE